MNFPTFDEKLSFLNQFILQLVNNYEAGRIDSWETFDEKVKAFFMPERMDQIEELVPGWKKMASYADGVTLTHVMCVFLGLFIMPEFQQLSPEQQQLAKWIVLFHDMAKAHIRGKHDATHGFRSAALAGNALKQLGFQVNEPFEKTIQSWADLTRTARLFSADSGDDVQDNSKLPEIISGIEKLYGMDSPAVLIIKGVLLHMSLNVVEDWPQPAPLNDTEIKKHIDGNLMPLLKVMCLADNEGWSMFYPETRIAQREETLAAFRRFEEIIAAKDFIHNTQSSYDTVALDYAERFKDEMDDKPFDRDCLDRLAHEANGLGPICDLGCGPGQIARYLHRKGVSTLGVDLSPNMIAEAQRLNPEIHFHVGNMLSLPDEDNSWGGIAAFYCIIHIPRKQVVDALREMKRVLKPNGILLIAFHIGEEIKHLDEWWDKSVNVDFTFYLPRKMESWLKETGYELVETLVRDPNPAVEVETRRAYIFARKTN